ncbi:MAG TPA: hypothetical protein VHC70_03750 [Phycisphaerales bacterium]|jgi:hypothetical protein|nr:hypothetical protein [Phycisphaerales bacterium]
MVDFCDDVNLDDRARVDALAALLALGVMRLMGRVDTPPSHPDSRLVGLEAPGPARPDGTVG